MVVKVAINGFGRLGRIVFRVCLQKPDVILTAINDPSIDSEYICYLMKFDSTHGRLDAQISSINDDVLINGKKVKVFHEKAPANIPWQTADVDYVIEASGMFTSMDKAMEHLANGRVKRVIVTAPSIDAPMIILGVNEDIFRSEQKVLSCTSSTMYCLAPIMKVLQDEFGVVDGSVTSIHAMTPSLKPLDGLCLRGKHWRDHRSISQNIIPAATGACKALGKIIPELKDKLSGLAFRVPIVDVSVLDITVRLSKNTSLEDIVNSVKKASETKMKDIVKINAEEVVSSDFIGDSYSCILDANTSIELKPNFYKLICWYENEYSYACRVVDTVLFSDTYYELPFTNTMVHIKSKLPKRQSAKETERDTVYVKAFKTKVSNSTSEDTGLKNKFLPPRRGLNSRPSHALNLNNPAKGDAREQLVCDNQDQAIEGPYHKNSIVRCITFVPSDISSCNDPSETTNVCEQAQEKLEKVKKEFTNMVNITEDLLKKSYCDKIQKHASKSSFNEVIPEVSEEIKPSNSTKESDKTMKTYTINPTYKFPCERDSRSPSLEFTENNYGYNSNTNLRINNASSKDLIATDPVDRMDYDFILVSDPDNKQNVETPPSETNEGLCSESTEFKQLVVKTISTLIDGLSNNLKILCHQNDITSVVSNEDKLLKRTKNKLKISSGNSSSTYFTNSFDIIKPKTVINNTDLTEEINKYNEKYKQLFVDDDNDLLYRTQQKSFNIPKENSNREDPIKYKGVEKLQIGEQIEKDDCLKKDSALFFIEKKSTSGVNRTKYSVTSTVREVATVSEQIKKSDINNVETSAGYSICKEDIFDKLDSESSSGSDSSFRIHERKSKIINISDVTDSLHDLDRLAKICQIIEISDNLSDRLFFPTGDSASNKVAKTWSFKDFCDKVKLDEFCNEVFGPSRL